MSLKTKIRVMIDARIPDHEFGGIRTYSQLLIKTALGMPGVETFALTSSDSTWVNDLLPENKIVRLGADARSFYQKLKSLPFVAKMARSLYYFLQLGPDKLPDRLLSYKFQVFHSAIQDAPISSARMIYHPHDLQHLILPKNFDIATRVHRSRVWRKIARESDVVIVGSQSVQREVSRFWPEISRKVAVIPVPPPELVFGSRVDSPWRNSVLYVAGLYPHKNQETLVRAYSKLPPIIQDSHPLLLVGSGPDRERIRRLALSLGSSSNIVLTGPLSQKEYEAILRNSSLVCVPSRYEAGSFPILEALVAGVPVIASNISAFEDICPGSIEIYGEPDDVDSLLELLQGRLQRGKDGNSGKAVALYLDSINSRVFRDKLFEIYSKPAKN
jgi:glycosyltransferase involved in cell wall biosynthesis